VLKKSSRQQLTTKTQGDKGKTAGFGACRGVEKREVKEGKQTDFK
jgi:hypothetical protein